MKTTIEKIEKEQLNGKVSSHVARNTRIVAAATELQVGDVIEVAIAVLCGTKNKHILDLRERIEREVQVLGLSFNGPDRRDGGRQLAA